MDVDVDMFGGGMMAMGASGDAGKNKGKGLSDEVFTNAQKISKESSKVACECNHGIMVEAMKKFMFDN
jgi:hypothetical protein